MNNIKQIPLGSSTKGKAIIIEKGTTIEDRVKILEKTLIAVTQAFYATRRALIKSKKNRNEQLNAHDMLENNLELNRDNIPVNTAYIGVTKGIPYILTVDKEGNYIVGNRKHTSLSAAAKFVSNVRRSGWTFWKTIDGETLKKAFRKK